MRERYVVPEGMLKAGVEAIETKGRGQYASVSGSDPQIRSDAKVALEAALRWLDNELDKIIKKRETVDVVMRSPSLADYYVDNGYNLAIIDVRHIFLAPEPEVPEEIADLLKNAPPYYPNNEMVIEAYRRGQKAGWITFQEEAVNKMKCARPEVPEGIKDMLWKTAADCPEISVHADAEGIAHNRTVLEAERRGFIRGQKSRKP
jgi:hypothetical protein